MKQSTSTWLIGLAILCVSPAYGQGLGVFDGHADVGGPQLAGDASFDPRRQEYAVSGSGCNIWFDHDEFHFVWKRLRGDFVVRARAGFLGEGVDPHRKLGWMVRSSLDSNATHVNAVVHGDGLTGLQWRRSVGGETEGIRSQVTEADVIQLGRRENDYVMWVARHGEPLVREAIADLVLGEDVYVGLFVSSHNEDVREEAVFRNVRIVVQAGEDLVRIGTTSGVISRSWMWRPAIDGSCTGHRSRCKRPTGRQTARPSSTTATACSTDSIWPATPPLRSTRALPHATTTITCSRSMVASSRSVITARRTRARRSSTRCPWRAARHVA